MKEGRFKWKGSGERTAASDLSKWCQNERMLALPYWTWIPKGSTSLVPMVKTPLGSMAVVTAFFTLCSASCRQPKQQSRSAGAHSRRQHATWKTLGTPHQMRRYVTGCGGPRLDVTAAGASSPESESRPFRASRVLRKEHTAAACGAGDLSSQHPEPCVTRTRHAAAAAASKQCGAYSKVVLTA